MSNDKSNYVRKNILIEPELFNHLDEMAKATVRTHTDMINFCIKEYYKIFKQSP